MFLLQASERVETPVSSEDESSPKPEVSSPKPRWVPSALLSGIDCFACYRTMIVRKSRDPLPRPAPAPAALAAAPAATSGKNRLAEEEEEMCRLVLEYGRLPYSAC